MCIQVIRSLANKKILILSALLTSAILLGMVEPAPAANLFKWNADCVGFGPTCTTSLGGIIDVFGATLDTVTKHSGVGSMKITIDNGQGNKGIEPGNVTLDPANDVYYRWWMKLDSAYRWGTGDQKLKGNRVKQNGDVQNGCCFTTHFTKTDISISECDNCSPPTGGGDNIAVISYNFDPATNSAVTNWREYILKIHFNTSSGSGSIGNLDGTFSLYIDGVLIRTITGLSYCCRTGPALLQPVEAWGGMMVHPYPQLNCVGTETCGGTLWVDDFSTDTVWNSNFGVQGDTTPPAIPTGLTIR